MPYSPSIRSYYLQLEVYAHSMALSLARLTYLGLVTAKADSQALEMVR